MQLTRNVTSRAQHIYKVADERELFKNRQIAAAIGACIVLAARDLKVSRSLSEVCKIVGASKKEMGQALHAIKTAIQIGPGDRGVGQSSMTGSVEGLLSRYINFMDLGMGVYNAATHVAERALVKTDIEGRNPISVAGGVLYFVCILFGNGITSKDIASRSDITESPIKL
jgi:transcription initiation factor TFIIB